MVDEAELAQTNASVTGASVNKQVAGVEKGVDNPETWQASETINKGDVGFSPSEQQGEYHLGHECQRQSNASVLFWRVNVEHDGRHHLCPIALRDDVQNHRHSDWSQ